MGALLAAIAGSSALAYHDASLAPHDRYEEMLSIDRRLDGRGPVLLNEYDEFAKYFLSSLQPFNEPESDHVYRTAPYSPNALRRPAAAGRAIKTPVDIDDLPLLLHQALPVHHPAPLADRQPPAGELPSGSAIGTYYELWQRRATPRVLRHVPVGRDSPASRGGRSRQRRRATVAARARADSAVSSPTCRARGWRSSTSATIRGRSRWGGFGSFPGGLVTDGPANTNAPVRIARSGRYRVWVEGSFARRIRVMVDFETIGHTPVVLNNPGAYALLGTVMLRRGLRGVQVRQRGGDLRPGNGGYRSSLRHIGPIVFSARAGRARGVRVIAPPTGARSSGVRSDWLEIVRR